MSWKNWYRKVYLKSNHWKKLKKQLFKERGKKCEKCGSKRKIHCHHIRYGFIYDITIKDLLIVCKQCHKKIHNK